MSLWPTVFLCGVCMFSQSLRGFSAGTALLPQNEPKCMFGSIGGFIFFLIVSERVNGLCVCVLWLTGDLSGLYPAPCAQSIDTSRHSLNCYDKKRKKVGKIIDGWVEYQEEHGGKERKESKMHFNANVITTQAKWFYHASSKCYGCTVSSTVCVWVSVCVFAKRCERNRNQVAASGGFLHRRKLHDSWYYLQSEIMGTAARLVFISAKSILVPACHANLETSRAKC